MAQDGVGQTLEIGDTVAYIRKICSSIDISVRYIIDIQGDMIKLDGKRSHCNVKSYNTVKLVKD